MGREARLRPRAAELEETRGHEDLEGTPEE